MKLLIVLTIVFIILVSFNFINSFINEKEGLWSRNTTDPMPEGSWKQSCKTNGSHFDWYKNSYDSLECKLKTKCKNNNNNYIKTNIIAKCNPPKKFKNINGVLTIE